MLKRQPTQQLRLTPRERVLQTLETDPPSRVDITRHQLAEILQALRIVCGISREELAAETGVQADLIEKLEDPEYCRYLPPHEAALQDQLLSFFGARPFGQPVPYELPTNWRQMRERLRQLKHIKDRAQHLGRDAVADNFVIYGQNLFDEV